MAVKIIDGDLLGANAQYICHQVNCKGRMGSGVAKQIRAKYPEVYDAYICLCNEGHNKKDPFWTFGQAQFVECHDGKTIVNMFAQSSYGYDGKLYTDYAAFKAAFRKSQRKFQRARRLLCHIRLGADLVVVTGKQCTPSLRKLSARTITWNFGECDHGNLCALPLLGYTG